METKPPPKGRLVMLLMIVAAVLAVTAIICLWIYN